MFVLLGHGYLFFYILPPVHTSPGWVKQWTSQGAWVCLFFAMPYIMHSSGHFKTVHRDLSLFSITPYTRLPDGGQVCTILKCPWTGPYIRALSKKRHTHAPTKRNVIKKIPMPQKNKQLKQLHLDHFSLI